MMLDQVVASWPKPLNATQYKLEYRKMGYDQNNNNLSKTWQDITGFSGFTESTDSNGQQYHIHLTKITDN